MMNNQIMSQLSNYMSRKICLLAVLTFSFVLLSCEKEEDKIQPKLFLETESVTASNSAAEYAVDFVTNAPWQASSNVDWISIAETNGDKGRHNLVFTVAANEDDERSGVITVSISEERTLEIQVVQDPGNRNDIFVKSGGTGDGTSWAKAASLDQALALAVDGNVIHIAAGTYQPGTTVSGGDDADEGDKSFQVSKNITLKGGYPENAAAGAVADPESHKTILSGGGTAYHVVLVSAPKIEGQKVVLEGLTITEGNAGTETETIGINGVEFRRNYGGGIIIGNSTVDIVNSEIVDNTSARHVAGLYAFGGSVVTIRNTKVDRNASASNGGGAWIHESLAFAYHSSFNGNSGGTAAGFHAYPDATAYLYNCEISDNAGRSYGAAFYARQNSRGVLVNCLITGNTSTSKNGGGGVMMYSNCEVDIISSTIANNTINGPGGGVYRRLGENVLSIYNSVISGNTQEDDGPDVDVYEADAAAPVVQASVLGANAYDGTGSIVVGEMFNPTTMFNATFGLIGAGNPALAHGMTATQLGNLGTGMEPALESSFLSADIYGNSRDGLTVMGAVVGAP